MNSICNDDSLICKNNSNENLENNQNLSAKIRNEFNRELNENKLSKNELDNESIEKIENNDSKKQNKNLVHQNSVIELNHMNEQSNAVSQKLNEINNSKISTNKQSLNGSNETNINHLNELNHKNQNNFKNSNDHIDQMNDLEDHNLIDINHIDQIKIVNEKCSLDLDHKVNKILNLDSKHKNLEPTVDDQILKEINLIESEKNLSNEKLIKKQKQLNEINSNELDKLIIVDLNLKLNLEENENNNKLIKICSDKNFFEQQLNDKEKSEIRSQDELSENNFIDSINNSNNLINQVSTKEQKNESPNIVNNELEERKELNKCLNVNLNENLNKKSIETKDKKLFDTFKNLIEKQDKSNDLNRENEIIDHCTMVQNSMNSIVQYKVQHSRRPIVSNEINSSTVAVDELFKHAESTYLLPQKSNKYNKTNNVLNDEDFEQLDRQAKDAEETDFNLSENLDLNLIKKSNENLNQNLNFDQKNQKSTYLNCDIEKFQKLNSFNLSNTNYSDQVSSASNLDCNQLNGELVNNCLKKINSEVIINYCEKIELNSIQKQNRSSFDTILNRELAIVDHKKPINLEEYKVNCKFKNSNLLNNSYNSIPFSSFDSLINAKSSSDRFEFVDIVKKIELPSSNQTKAECIILDEEDDEDELLIDKENEKIIDKQERANNQKNDYVDFTKLDKEPNKLTNLLSVIESTQSSNQSKKMSTLISPSNKIELFDDLDHSSSNKKMDPANLILKPLKGLLKKARSSDSTDSGSTNSKKKRRVKFAETMMVFCPDWPDELMPQLMPLALKSSEFNLVEITAQSYMFEPPAEYKDFLPFDPPDDYADESANELTNIDKETKNLNAKKEKSLQNQKRKEDKIMNMIKTKDPYVNNNQLNIVKLDFADIADYRDQLDSTNNDLNFANLPNHALLQMYENDMNQDSVNENFLSKLDFDDDMFMKFSYANAVNSANDQDFCNLLKTNQLIEDNEQLDAYKDMILNNSNEMLEDDIIGVLKEDNILQAIGSQINSLDKKDNASESSTSGSSFDATFEDDSINNNKDDTTTSSSCPSGSIIIVNKNIGNSQNKINVTQSLDELNSNQQTILTTNADGLYQPIQIITSNENSDITFSNLDDTYNPISPNGSLQDLANDLASDSSITSQDTIIMMTNAILTDKTHQHNLLPSSALIDLQNKRHRLKLSSDLNQLNNNTKESSNSLNLRIMDSTDSNTESLKDKDDESMVSSNDENNNSQENQGQIKSTNSSLINNNQLSNDNKSINQGVNGVPKLIKKYSNATTVKQTDAQLTNSTNNFNSTNNKIEKNSSISVSELRESFERRMSLNSDKSDNSSSQSSSSSSTNNQHKQTENIYQNIPINNNGSLNFENEQVLNSDNKQWQQNEANLIVEYTSEPKVLVPNKRTTSLQPQQSYPSNNIINNNNNNNNNNSNKNQKSSPSQLNSTQINHVQNTNTQPASPQQQQQQLINQQQILNQQILNQQNKLNQLNLMQTPIQTIPVQRMPNGNIYLSIDRRTLGHQIKVIQPTQISQIRPPPYELSSNAITGVNQQATTIKQQATVIHPHYHLVNNMAKTNQLQQNSQSQMVQTNQSNNNQQSSVNSNKINQTPNQNPTVENNNNNNNNKQIPQFHYQTLPIRFATNAKQTRIQPNLTNLDGKCCPNQTNLTSAPNVNQQQNKPQQLILIHSYPNLQQTGGVPAIRQLTNLGHLAGNQKTIAIKIHHPATVGQPLVDKLNSNQQTILTETTPTILTANGKIITTVTSNGTLLNSINSNALIQQTLMQRNSSFPNAAEIRRRDGLNALPNLQDAQINKQQQTVKDELESFVQQDLQRTERIRKRYSHAEEEMADDPTFGFAQRPSVRGIRSANKFGGSTEQIIKQLSVQNNNAKTITNNLIQLNTTNNKAATLQRPNSQIILTSNQLKNQDLSKLTQPVKIATTAIPVIQNNQRHVYLIQPNQVLQQSNNQLGTNFQQQQRTLIQHSGISTLPRNSTTATLSTPSTNLLVNAPVKNSSQSNTNTNNNSNTHMVNCNKINLAGQPNTANLGQLQSANTGIDPNSLQYKTISMPNVALINGKTVAFINQQQKQTLTIVNNQSNQTVDQSQLKTTGSKLITTNNLNKDNNQQNNNNSSTIKSSTITKQASSSSTNSTNSSLNNSSTISSTNNNNQQQSNNKLINNLVKDGKKEPDKQATNVSKLKQVNNKDEIKFYSMNV